MSTERHKKENTLFNALHTGNFQILPDTDWRAIIILNYKLYTYLKSI